MIRVGIADAHGIESYMSEEASTQKMVVLQMRATANRQRHTCLYRVEVDEATDANVKALINDGDFIGALECLKTNVEEVKLTVGTKNSWTMIPNPKLDPWG